MCQKLTSSLIHQMKVLIILTAYHQIREQFLQNIDPKTLTVERS